MSNSFTISDLRREMGIGLAEFGLLIGLTSKSRVSEIERGAPVSLPVSLKLEQISGGRLDAAELNGEVAAARCGLARCGPSGSQITADDLVHASVSIPAAGAGKAGNAREITALRDRGPL